ncbi:MAG: tRNA epoxyqueuosine(34) reductase QueG [Candidatus Omnitrophota bacterium]|jgi:epoxyqueuosine reductase|nr:MAG: tRNA epoxyqueuosine(34) reductase QueG [Candidatus Omnitrophota bacterium]
MKEQLKAFAKSIGFDAVGIARSEPKTWDRYAEWLARGFHGEMEYLARRSLERRDISYLFKNPQSVIVAAKRYLTIDPIDHKQRPFQPVVSRYAWGDDYHAALRDGLNRICRWIEEKTNGVHTVRSCVDSAPILERDFAAQAGIGWFGKHTNLLNRSLGNWFFLGVVITSLELEEDEPVSSYCGTCTRCLDSCPTNAFVGPYLLDARRCISYLTIEVKGAIPRELRPLMGARVFGCDDCLAVCPWNRFAVPTAEITFFPRDTIETSDLIELLGLTDEEFRARYKKSPIKRSKRRGFLRNVAIALGNTGDPRAIPALARALSDHEPLIRSHAAWALGRIGGDEAKRILMSALNKESEEAVREEIQFAIDPRVL